MTGAKGGSFALPGVLAGGRVERLQHCGAVLVVVQDHPAIMDDRRMARAMLAGVGAEVPLPHLFS